MFIIQIGEGTNKAFVRMFGGYEYGNQTQALTFDSRSDADYEIFKIHSDQTTDLTFNQLKVVDNI